MVEHRGVVGSNLRVVTVIFFFARKKGGGEGKGEQIERALKELCKVSGII